ncbi:phosphatidylinositol-glycan biosynthesis class W protein-like [Antedon mediterranea]|uniref:phosphatidylinositol-glycan biosynthesis class W protein-like n=1 Tax=Antedon mediterranea TaxID=105859 RepID=UPI003AF4E615
MADKEEKELFYSNLIGTSAVEVASLTLVGTLVVFLRSQLQPWLIVTKPPTKKHSCFVFVIDFLTMILPMVTCCTYGSDHIQHVLVLLLVAAITLHLIQPGDLKPSVHSYLESSVSSAKLPFVSSLRLCVLFSTTISILAVDFHIFPRRFAKTETFGVSLMDGGVGMFIFINGLVSSEARTKQLPSGLVSKLSKVQSNMMTSLPLLLLGLMRLLSVRLADYHQHVSEYGVHWNFFLSLFFVRIISSLLFVIIPISFSGMLLLLVTFTYQHLLTNCGLQEYILNGPDGTGSRIGWISANREGIFSCIGFTSIYLGGVSIGRLLFRKSWSFSGSVRLLGCLWGFTILFWCILNQLPSYTGEVSRRLGNASYIVWILAQGVFSLATFLLVDIVLAWQQDTATKSDTDMFLHLKHPANQSNLLHGVNAHQLLFFLLGNLLTGLVNLTINTLTVSNLFSFLIIVFYMALLCSVTTVMQYKGIKFKFL